MTQPESKPMPNIELDLEASTVSIDSTSRRNKPISQEPSFSIPKIEHILGADYVGSDEAEQTVGYFFLITAIPGLISLLLGHGVGLIGVVIPVLLGIGLLRGNELAKHWVFVVCLVQLILGPISALVSPSSIVYVLGGLGQSGGLLVLVSGKALSKQSYRIAVSAVIIGTLIGIIGSLLH